MTLGLGELQRVQTAFSRVRSALIAGMPINADDLKHLSERERAALLKELESECDPNEMEVVRQAFAEIDTETPVPAQLPATTPAEPKFVRYEAARRALTEAVAVDEVKAIRDESIAMKAYAKQAKDTELEEKAVELRMRAARRLDEMMKAQKDAVGFNKGGKAQQELYRVMTKPGIATLADAGIDKNLAHEARRLGKLSDEEFEHEVEEAKANVRAPRQPNFTRQLMNDARAKADALREISEVKRLKAEIELVAAYCGTTWDEILRNAKEWDANGRSNE